MRFFRKSLNLDSCTTCPEHVAKTLSSSANPEIPLPSSTPEISLVDALPASQIQTAVQSRISSSRKATISESPPAATAISVPLDVSGLPSAWASQDDIEKLREVWNKYNPESANVPKLWPMSEHRDMMRTMFLDNILYSTARLHRHTWILGAENKVYTSLCGTARWDLIHDDLDRYTKAIKGYEFWLTSFIQRQELEPCALPPTYQFYGRTLALLELATNPLTKATLTSCERALLASMEQSFVAGNHTWSQANAIARRERFRISGLDLRRKGLISRMLMATFGGSTLIVPTIIMTLDSRLTTTLITTSVFTLGIGLISAFWMDDADTKDIIGATAAYAAVLVVFVGTGNGFDNRQRGGHLQPSWRGEK